MRRTWRVGELHLDPLRFSDMKGETLAAHLSHGFLRLISIHELVVQPDKVALVDSRCSTISHGEVRAKGEAISGAGEGGGL